MTCSRLHPSRYRVERASYGADGARIPISLSPADRRATARPLSCLPATRLRISLPVMFSLTLSCSTAASPSPRAHLGGGELARLHYDGRMLCSATRSRLHRRREFLVSARHAAGRLVIEVSAQGGLLVGAC